MSFADYDLDGDLDGYLLTNRLQPIYATKQAKVMNNEDGTILIHPDSRELAYFVKPPNQKQKLVPAAQFDHFYQNENGYFVDVSMESGIGAHPYYGLSAVWWDYNDDGWPDIYVANDYMGPDHLYRNNGPNDNGEITFTDAAETALPHTPWFSMGSDYSDINNDGRLDFLASDMAGSNHYRDKLSMGSKSGPESDSWFLNFLLVARDRLSTAFPLGMYLTSGSTPTLPNNITLFIAISAKDYFYQPTELPSLLGSDPPQYAPSLLSTNIP